MFETSLKIEEEVNSIPSNMSGRYHRNKSQQQHRTKSKLRYVNKSELIVSSPNSVAVEQPVSSEDVIVNNNNNTVDDVASSSKTKTKEEYDYDNNDIDNGMDNTNRLDKLLTDIQQIELSEEEITINDQLQQDELLVVESIYGENVFSLDTWKGLRCFQIHINIDVLGEIGITAKVNSVNELETLSNNSDDFLYSFKVQYLPPIVLTCLLPKSYPSHQPPIFTISVKWLESAKILSLCSKLDSIWTEQQGQEVIYSWVEWLQNSSLSHLGFDEEIRLGPYGWNRVADARVVSGIGCIDADIPFLQSYNNERRHQNFLKELHECCVCYSEYPGTEFVRLPCKHFFCRKCLQTFTQIHVKEGNVSNLQCLDAKCKEMIPPGLLKHFLGDEEYERWESMMLEKTLASMSDVAYCPRCETPCIEEEDQHAQCPKCFFSFCTLCRERRHVGIACMTLEMKLQLLQDRQNSSHLKGNQKQIELAKINEMLSIKAIHRDSKLCPYCDMAISRTGGCNKMKCGNCGKYFCYLCNKALDPSDPYGHFREGGSCELFPQEMVDNWQPRINPRQEVQQIHAELFHLGGSACPSCRQFNVKIGNNNHMLCWACQSHYCYLCNKTVRRGTKHYGPKGCKQHTEG
ncbi:putative transcription factor C2H2 family [Medicago truncatula]|uniref:RBR-type E3 ubiquitin transferase n=1 Tax=Medicago truncatula TaxID=3880 RepID=G7KDN8_MEDTR|nr:E3 ubiquitin-protein ligase RNF14 [Medicago truncatula]AES95805.1 NDR1/HIN1-like protein [Medicago truncatula]RHN54811.1 putative transcription factor C2H2 family [Medicago truncatula]